MSIKDDLSQLNDRPALKAMPSRIVRSPLDIARIDELEAVILAAKVLLEPTNEATEYVWQMLDDAYHRQNPATK